MDISEEELVDEFAMFNVALDDPDVIDKLKELCLLLRVDADGMVEEWMAFSLTKKHCPINLETLDQFSREKLKQSSSKAPKSAGQKNAGKNVIHDMNSIDQVIDTEAAENLLDAYSTPAAKQSIKKRQVTPENITSNKRLAALGRSPAVPFSPTSFSPSSATPSKKYGSRSNAGEVSCSFGDSQKVSWRGQGKEVTISPFDPDTTLHQKIKYMFQKLSDKAHVLNEQIDELGAVLQKKLGVDEFSHVALPVQEEVTVVGRVCCDSNGKLNAKSVVLEGSRDTSAGRHIPVDLSGVPNYSLFPGQVVAMNGSNTTGNKFIATKIHEGVPLSCPEVTPASPLSIVVAAGPYTTSDSLAYEPLADLVKYLQKEQPDICILMGPFVDSKHSSIENCTIDMSYEDLFREHIKKLNTSIERLPTQLIVVPSQRDVHHSNIYPQPPFSLPDKMDTRRIHFMSDPCTLVIDGVVIALTSTDILFHLGAEEISFPPGGADRLARLTQHLLTQHNFYPLYPPNEDVNIDYDHFETFAKLPVTPHVLITPSELKPFIKEVSGCCCINPGRLTKGQVGGFYGRVVVRPTMDGQPIMKGITGEVRRI